MIGVRQLTSRIPEMEPKENRAERTVGQANSRCTLPAHGSTGRRGDASFAKGQQAQARFSPEQDSGLSTRSGVTGRPGLSYRQMQEAAKKQTVPGLTLRV